MNYSVYFIFYYIVAGFSFAGNLAVTGIILHHGIRSSYCRLIFYLHFTQLLQGVASLVNIYENIGWICKFMAALRAYSSIANVTASFFLTISAHDLIFRRGGMNPSSYQLPWWQSVIIFAFPMITLLPLITDTYGVEGVYWCSFQSNDPHNLVWSIAVFYAWIWLLILISALFLGLLLWKVRRDPQMKQRILQTLGVYSFIGIITWTPRSLVRLGLITDDFTAVYTAFLFVYISGILYVFTYSFEMVALIAFEDFLNSEYLTNSNYDSSNEGSSSVKSWSVESKRIGSAVSTESARSQQLMQGDQHRK